MNNKNKVALGAGIAATVATLAGAYYFYGSLKGPEHRKQLKSWMVHMKAEVMAKLEKVKDINSDAYNAIVTNVTKKYKQLKNVDPKEVAALASRMKDHWKDIKKDIENTTRFTIKNASIKRRLPLANAK